jgi:pimeloyl-ACP methyl ester carboxylesterase
LAVPLADEFRVLEPMQRRTNGATMLTVADHVEDLAGVLEGPTLIVGWSWGAMLALSFAVATTDDARDAIVKVRGARAEAAQSYDLLPEPTAASALLTFVDARGHQETWNDVIRLQADGTEPAAFTAITAPVLMLHGDDDPHPGLATFELQHRYIPQLEYFGLDRCGHTPWKERRARTQFFDALCVWLHTHA